MIITGKWVIVRSKIEAILESMFLFPEDQFFEFDSILSVDEMQKLEYARNFPHLTCLSCSVPQDMHVRLSSSEIAFDHDLTPSSVNFALLPATCYKVFLSLCDTDLHHAQYINCIARCFRNEDKPLDEYRGLNFTMKEFVCVGDADAAKKHLDTGINIIGRLLSDLGFDHDVEVASDPFFDKRSSNAVLSKLLPTKREFVFDGHAVASANFHRNYFGEKFTINLNGEPANTSCVAFGLERWISMFQEVFATPEKAIYALDSLNKSTKIVSF